MRSDDWYVTEDLDRFLSHAGGFLRSRPDLHTVALTVTESLRMRGLNAYGGDEPPVFGVMERDGQVRGAYFRTPPYRLNVTPLTADETDALAAHLVAVGHPVPGIIGTRETVTGFVRSWQRHTGATAALRQRQRRRAHHRNASRTLDKLLAMGALPVVNENDTVATDEIRFGDNDRLAALVAHLVRADLLVLLSDVDGVYDGDPSKPGTSRIAEVRGPDDLAHVEIGSAGKAGVGTGGMVTKVEAARIAAAAGIPVVLTSAVHAAEALSGGDTGTYFHATGRRSADRLLWLQHASTPQGSLTLDDGAVRAVVERRKSLLPAGIAAVEGEFSAGDPVELRDAAGRAVARGLVSFDAREIPQLIGRSTHELARELGPAYEREVVHRDDLVLLEP